MMMMPMMMMMMMMMMIDDDDNDNDDDDASASHKLDDSRAAVGYCRNIADLCYLIYCSSRKRRDRLKEENRRLKV